MALSVVIPTMQKNTKVLIALLKNVSKDKIVDEIILIDNTGKGFDDEIYSIDKLKVVINSENKYVNPTWNQGIKLSKNKYWALLNDDIIVSSDFCSTVLGKMPYNAGIIGVANESVKTLKPDNLKNIVCSSSKNLKLKKVDKRFASFGIAMFGRNSSYYFIPDDLLIWYGDDYLFKMNRKNFKQNYAISDIDIFHLHSLTSANPIFKDVILRDDELYNKKYLKTLYSIKDKFFSKQKIFIDGMKYNYLYVFGLSFLLYSKPVHFDFKYGCWVE